MAELVRCKACGDVAVSDKIKEVCPACGVPAKMFAPFNSPISLKRRRILDLHTHPVMVHFPQDSAQVMTLFCACLGLIGGKLLDAKFPG